MRRFGVCLALLFPVAALAADEPPFDAQKMMMEQAASTRQAAEAAEAKRKAAQAAEAKRSPCAIKGGVSVGMTRAQVYASCWGRPERINTTTTAAGDFEQLVYPGYQYLYMRNGVVTSIQTTR